MNGDPPDDSTVDAAVVPSAPAATIGDALPHVAQRAYSLGDERGRGGLGRVVQARDHRLDRDVAVKQALRSDAATEHRLVREARLTARLQHPSIVPVHELGRLPGGEPFYAMKLVSGRTLAELLDEGATLDDRLALLPSVIAVAEAIAFAHHARIVHRDLKPANILVGSFRRPPRW